MKTKCIFDPSNGLASITLLIDKDYNLSRYRT